MKLVGHKCNLFLAKGLTCWDIFKMFTVNVVFSVCLSISYLICQYVPSYGQFILVIIYQVKAKLLFVFECMALVSFESPGKVAD